MGLNWLFLWKKASDSKSAFTPGEKTWMENHRGQVDVTDSVRRIAMRVGLSELCQEK